MEKPDVCQLQTTSSLQETPLLNGGKMQQICIFFQRPSWTWRWLFIIGLHMLSIPSFLKNLQANPGERFKMLNNLQFQIQCMYSNHMCVFWTQKQGMILKTVYFLQEIIYRFHINKIKSNLGDDAAIQDNAILL